MNEKNKSPKIATADKKNCVTNIVTVYSKICPNAEKIAKADCANIREPNRPEKVFLGLHLLRAGPLKIFPNI